MTALPSPTPCASCSSAATRPSDPLAQQVVRVLAAGGAGVDQEVLAEITGLPTDELEGALREAIDAGVLVITGRRYDFRHALVREAVVDELLPGESTRVHIGYASALESRAAATDAGGRGRRAHLVPLDGGARARGGVPHLARRHAPQPRRLRLRQRRPARRAGAPALGPRAEPGERRRLTHVELLDHTALAWRNAGEGARALATIDLALAEADPGRARDRRPPPPQQGRHAHRRRAAGCGGRLRAGARAAPRRLRSRCCAPTSWPSSPPST